MYAGPAPVHADTSKPPPMHPSRATALHFTYRPSLDWHSLCAYLAARAAIPGEESLVEGRYARTIRVRDPVGMLSVAPASGSALAMTQDWFLAHAEQVLASTLTHGDTVDLDNLPAHKGAAIGAATRHRARLRFLPPYSPDFNPYRDGPRQAQGAAGRLLHQ